MSNPVKAAFSAAHKENSRVSNGLGDGRYISARNHPQGGTSGTAEVIRAQALLLGHLYQAKHVLTRAQHRALVQDMVDWALAMDAKEKLIVALAEDVKAKRTERKPEGKPRREPENPALERRAAA